MALAKLITKSNRKSLEILYYGKRWMLGSLIQLATQGIETQLHINPPIVSYRIGLSGYEVDLELPVLGFLGLPDTSFNSEYTTENQASTCPYRIAHEFSVVLIRAYIARLVTHHTALARKESEQTRFER